LASHDFPLSVNQQGLAQLNERSREIFRLIVESYLATGEPVGSRNLSRILPMTLSPASVRNVMSDLEQLGLVYAPHTSAGRLPTEMGLRFFVDALMQIGDLTERDRKAIEAQVAASGQSKSVEGVLTEASGLLSGLSRAAGVVLTAKANPRLKHVEFVRLEPERALVILVGEDGQVENRVLNVPVGLPTSALIEASNFLNARIRGHTLDEVKVEIERTMRDSRAELDQLTQRIVADGLASWSGGERDERKLIVRGHANLLDDLKAVEDLERVRRLFDEHHFTRVAHLAAESHVDRSIADPEAFLGGVPEQVLAVHGVPGAPAGPGAGEIARCFQVGHDDLDGALGQADGGADVADPRGGGAGDLYQHVPMPGQQRPAAAALVRNAHTRRVYPRENNHARTSTRKITPEIFLMFLLTGLARIPILVVP